MKSPGLKSSTFTVIGLKTLILDSTAVMKKKWSSPPRLSDDIMFPMITYSHIWFWFQFHDVLSQTDKALAMVKDLFGDNPKVSSLGLVIHVPSIFDFEFIFWMSEYNCYLQINCTQNWQCRCYLLYLYPHLLFGVESFQMIHFTTSSSFSFEIFVFRNSRVCHRWR